MFLHQQNVTKDNTKNVLNIVDKISGALGKQQAVGDKAKKIKTPFLDLATGRKNLNDLAGEDDDDDDEGGFQLPNPKALFGGANASDSGDGAMDSIGSTVRILNKPSVCLNTRRLVFKKTVFLRGRVR